MDLDSIINDAIFELTNNAINKLRETDTELDTAIIRTAELSETVRDIIEKLPVNERTVINEYRDLKAEADDKQLVECYKQGVRDCVAILKKLGVI